MHCIHLEASEGWGGQEMRTFKEALSMQEKGHTVWIGANPKATLLQKAKEAGLPTQAFSLKRKQAVWGFFQLLQFLRQKNIERVLTHSSWDAWLGGVVAKCLKIPIIRTRHLSTHIRGGWNAYLLYNLLANYTVTTCQRVADTIEKEASLPPGRVSSIPTGITPEDFSPLQEKQEGKPFTVGTLCVFRSWKGLSVLVQALKETLDPSIQLHLIGDGPMRLKLETEVQTLGLQEQVHFTGFLDKPQLALEKLDVFALLSTAHEGVSQASLQAAFLAKPLVTTTTGGLDEVCLDGKTGFTVPCHDPKATAKALLWLKNHPERREEMGQQARKLVIDTFTWDKTIAALAEVLEKVR